MNAREIRQSFLDFFAQHGHRVVPSSSLVPADDPTLLFTNAGMNQFKELFLGRERRDYSRAATAQKCMRVSGKHNDLDNVGPSHRHHTFFEMLGNFSFGDYFKEEAIDLAWRMLTEVWRLPPERLRASVFGGEAGVSRDDEAYRLWRNYLPADCIDEFGLEENFWQMGDTGPCGRCSEIYVDRSVEPGVPEENRLVEVWNNVFMEFNRQPDGRLDPLPAPSIDTGMGLERITAVIQGKFSNYDTDLFQPLLAAIGDLAGQTYGAAEAADVSMRVVADHIRATTFLIADGVVPSNEWRGYVLRKIMRRAMRHGKRLGLREPFMRRLVDVVVHTMSDAYPELRGNRDTIVGVVSTEEDRFDAVLTAGLPRLEDLLERAGQSPSRRLAGEDVFRLYDSLGVPLDFIEDLASERHLTIDREGYDRAMAAQRERARAGSTFDQKRDAAFSVVSDDTRQALANAADRFEGYTGTRLEDARVLALFGASRTEADELSEGARGYLVTDRTPFYLEAGGQVSDTGVVQSPNASADVVGMVRLHAGGPRAHEIVVRCGAFKPGEVVSLVVDAVRRDAIRRNHTATHLLHAALRQVLGPHVKQAGSLVAPDRLRFDFVHQSALSEDEVGRIEALVTEQILRDTVVTTEIKPTREALASGAMALFGEKYGDTVRVVTIPSFSIELCGGTHCAATGEIGLFSVTSEAGVAAGVRRIEALTGTGAYEQYRATQSLVARIVQKLNTTPEQAPEAVERLQAEVKRLGRELQDLRVKSAMGPATASTDDMITIDGATLITRQVSGLDRAALRTLADSLKERIKTGVVILASETDGKVALVVAVTKNLADRVEAGQIVRHIAPIVGGGGGGRADFAEAGGKDPARIADLFEEGRAVVARMLGSGATV
jgi:alanyl-tRNA synthetase